MKASKLLALAALLQASMLAWSCAATPDAKSVKKSNSLKRIETGAPALDSMDDAMGASVEEGVGPAAKGDAGDAGDGMGLTPGALGKPTLCMINLHWGLPGGAPVACRGVTLPNWFADNDGGAHLESARCMQRAKEWSDWCGVPRRTTTWFQANSGAGFATIQSSANLALPIAAGYVFQAGFDYWVAN